MRVLHIGLNTVRQLFVSVHVEPTRESMVFGFAGLPGLISPVARSTGNLSNPLPRLKTYQ
ncbi:hypothetical protein [Terasakiella pusilla]|uniref:hypothetical protein n=1 Tax=Terasakiella pusilla TaxID=64973 RepID=UPI003AA90D83